MTQILTRLSIVSALSVLPLTIASAQVFQRQDMEACKRRYQQPLNISIDVELDRVCANYMDANLDCASGVMRDFGLTNHLPAIRLCLLKVTQLGRYSCAVRNMVTAKSAGQPIDIDDQIKICPEEPRQVATQPPPPANPRQSTAQPPPSQAPRRVVYLLGKIDRGAFVEGVAKWLGVQPRVIAEIDINPYFTMINGMLETIAVSGGRDFRLYKVSFRVTNHKLECTGTDFAPRGSTQNGSNLFTLHECTVNGVANTLVSQFRNLNYDYLNHLSPAVQSRIRDLKGKWSGSGNISFDRASSEYFVFGY